MATVGIISSGGRYVDPWHPFDLTSEAIAAIARALGHEVRVVNDVDAALASLGSDTDRPALVVLNLGNPSDSSPTDAARTGLAAYVRGGGSLLAVHSSATTFADWDEWQAMLGGRWIRGTTFHPPKSIGTVHVRTDAHPIVQALGSFEVDDELYSALAVEPDVTVLAEHVHEGVRHPFVWVNAYGSGRVVYDALGHDLDSFTSVGRVELLEREIQWLLGALPTLAPGPQ